MTVLLDAYAARSCPVKTQNAFDRTLSRQLREPDESLAELFDGGAAFETTVLDAWADAFPGQLVDLRDHEGSNQDKTRACLAALRSGAGVVLGGWLPIDPFGRRRGRPDALVRGADQPDGTPRYHPVEVKWHKVVERRPIRLRVDVAGPAGEPKDAEPTRSTHPTIPDTTLAYTTLTRPSLAEVELMEGHGARIATREADLLQLAHYYRMLESLGYAASDDARVAVIGTDALLAEPMLAWVDLAEPLVRTFSRTDPEGWRLRSLLERYDHEYAFRLDVATVASEQTGHPEVDPALLVRPIVTRECGRCPWWEHCRPQLHADDVSLRIDKGPLDVREIATLRSFGVHTITDLASADIPALLDNYLPEVTHRRGSENRLRVATRRARMLLSGRPLERETTGAIELPEADVEIDFDIETSADGRIYLWGFLVHERASRLPPRYLAFSRFSDLDLAGEADLACEALSWLRDQSELGRTVRVYHYSSYEVAALRGLADRHDERVFGWAVSWAHDHFVDLLEVVQTHFFGVAGLGLKVVAQQGAGFHWRDEDPGGLNSQRWFAEAVHEESAVARAAARQRVLDYNEDDVIATARVRAWLRAS